MLFRNFFIAFTPRLCTFGKFGGFFWIIKCSTDEKEMYAVVILVIRPVLTKDKKKGKNI